MRLLDLYCCEGGAAVGYARAGFTVTGVDIVAKYGRRYPYAFIAADAIEYRYSSPLSRSRLPQSAAIRAALCGQAYTAAPAMTAGKPRMGK